MREGVSSMEGYNFSNKIVLLRADFNLPLSKEGEILDETRLVRTLPTIHKILQHKNSRLVLISHMGRPCDAYDSFYSLRPVAARLSKLLFRQVLFCDSCVGEVANSAVRHLRSGEVLLLENLRFHSGERKNDASFAKRLASYGDVFVDDAFGNAHRSHASNTGIVRHFDEAMAGLLLQEEIRSIDRAIVRTGSSKVALVGGSKVSDKMLLLAQLLSHVDTLLVGGGMAYTFAYAQGCEVGGSLLEKDKVSVALSLLEKAEHHGKRVLLPVDVVTSRQVAEKARVFVRPLSNIPCEECGVDMGPKTCVRFEKHLLGAETIIWNGPVGIFEFPAFARGTFAMARAIAKATRRGSYSVVGGGDSVAALNQVGLVKEISHVSTGGGAMLAYLEGRVMPGIEALKQKSSVS